MLFPKNIAGKVARGEATLTIRPAVSRKPAHGARRSVKVHQKGATACHITIVDVQDMLAGEVTYRQARACGYRTPDEFKAEWVYTHERKWREHREDVEEGQDVERFDKRHAHTPCYAITFKLAVDTPRFLAQPGPNQGDYTEQRHRAIDDLEVVDEATLARYAKTAEGFCIGRQRKRQQEMAAEQAERKAQRRPWVQAA